MKKNNKNNLVFLLLNYLDINISEFIENGDYIFFKNSLVSNKDLSNSFLSDSVLFIKVSDKFVPTRFFLKLLFQKSDFCVNLGSEKDALAFTYGKNMLKNKILFSKLNLGEVLDRVLFNQIANIETIYFPVVYKNDILGICKYNFDLDCFENVMNVGEYLRES